MLDVILDSIRGGLPYALLAVGVFISYRVLDFADMTTESSFVLGGATSIVLILFGCPPIIATLMAVVVGMLCGLITGLLHTKLKIPQLLSGIITMTGLTSICMFIMGFYKIKQGQKPSFSELYDTVIRISYNVGGKDPTIYRYFAIFDVRNYNVIIALILIVGLFVALVYFFFGTEIGMSMRATGMNQKMARSQGINTTLMIILGLALANGLVALGGSLIAQNDFSMSTTKGAGTIVIGLAAIIIGEAIFGKRSFLNWIVSVALGAIVYQFILTISIYIGMPSYFDKLLLAVLVVVLLAIPTIKSQISKSKSKKAIKVGE